MPKPKRAEVSNENNEVEIDFKSILKEKDTKTDTIKNVKNSNTTIEKSILEKIKNN
jgi:hypothetical protein